MVLAALGERDADVAEGASRSVPSEQLPQLRAQARRVIGRSLFVGVLLTLVFWAAAAARQAR